LAYNTAAETASRTRFVYKHVTAATELDSPKVLEN